MKVLWITNTLFPDVCEALKIEVPGIGGWMYAAAAALLESYPATELAVATIYSGNRFICMEIKGIAYYLLPAGHQHYDVQLENHWKRVKAEFLPDMVHIHGTEYPHALAYVKACGNKHLVVSIQGLVSVYQRYYYGGINLPRLWRNLTLRDLVRRDTIFGQKREMFKRGTYEKELILSVDYVIGRTAWDESHVRAINPAIQYNFGNETLREEFYKHNWSHQNCEKNSIFLSQGHYPIKGLQQMISALPLILKSYPNTIIYVAGIDFSNKSFYKLSAFGKLIKKMISRGNLQAHIVFTGPLPEKEMAKRFLLSNVFICPSAIENSPNSIGEAQLIGMPCIGAYAGGMSDMIKDGVSGLLYRFEETEMLASAVCSVFSDRLFAERLGKEGERVAALRHNKESNVRNLFKIYETICSNSSH